MTRARLTQALSARGFEEPDAATRARLIEEAGRAHERSTGHLPSWRWLVPGRVEVFGKHTDYAGGRSLLAAVPRDIAVAASPRSDGLVRVRDATRGQEGVVDSANARASFSGWLTYVAVVVRRLSLNFPGASWGLDMTLASDLPRAAGLSSSSALVVSAASALIRRAGLEARPEWDAVIRTRLDLAGYLGALERGAAFGSFAGTSAVGTFGGSEDHTAILTCRPDLLTGYRFVPIRSLGEVVMPADWRFVIASSGVEADKAGNARDCYNRASLATGALVELWNGRSGQLYGTLADVLASGSGVADELGTLIAEHPRGDFDPGVLARRLEHFVAEDARVPEAMRAFQEADRGPLGALARASQQDAERLLENQTDETRTLTRLATENGAFAACSFGAGFGGSVWALTASDEARAFGERWIAKYRARYPGLESIDWFVARPGPSLLEL